MKFVYFSLIFFVTLSSQARTIKKKWPEYKTIRERLQGKIKASEEKRMKNAGVPATKMAEKVLDGIKSNGVSGVNAIESELTVESEKKAIYNLQERDYEDSVGEMKTAIAMGEGVEEYKMSSREVKLNGTYEVMTYDLIMNNGLTRKVKFIYIDADLSGVKRLMEFKVID